MEGLILVKKRVITGAVLIALIILILWINIPLVDTIFILLISLMGMYEYNKAFKSAGYNVVPIVGYISCFSILLMGLNIPTDITILISRIAIPSVLIVTFIYSILSKLKITIIDVAITILSIVYIPFLFSFLKLILMMEHGRLFIWFVIMGAFACDTFAFLIGCKFGKNKLCPEVSPKKTIEGSIAGILGVVITYIIIYVIARFCLNIYLNIWIIMLMALVSGIIGQFGDLAASSIKRFCKIKDFGLIMPGHGGILDRCDSIMFVAPIVYMILKVYMFM